MNPLEITKQSCRISEPHSKTVSTIICSSYY